MTRSRPAVACSRDTSGRPLHIEISLTVPRVAPSDAARWWSDFQEGRHDHPFAPGTRRVIIERAEGRVVMRDVTPLLGMRLFDETTTAYPHGREVRFHGENGLATFEGAYIFAPADDGTRIRLVSDVRLRRGLAWSGFAARPIIHAVLRADLRGHAKEMQRDIGPP